jgi:hypothetical protein
MVKTISAYPFSSAAAYGFHLGISIDVLRRPLSWTLPRALNQPRGICIQFKFSSTCCVDRNKKTAIGASQALAGRLSLPGRHPRLFEHRGRLMRWILSQGIDSCNRNIVHKCCLSGKQDWSRCRFCLGHGQDCGRYARGTQHAEDLRRISGFAVWAHTDHRAHVPRLSPAA